MRIEANGLSFKVVVAGDGPAVLLLHGFPDTHRLWLNQIETLTDSGFSVVAPDLRGFGESDKPEGVEHYSMLNVIEDLKGILDEVGVEGAHIVGHDFGAATAWIFTSVYSDRALSLTALSVGHPNAFRAAAGYEQLMRSWYMFMFQFEGVAEQWLSRNDWEFVRQWGSLVPDIEERIEFLSAPGALTAALNWYRANLPPESWISDPLELPPISVPTMGVWSTNDIALTEEQMTGSQKYVTGPWRYERLEDIGHWIPTEAPGQLNELLLDFLRS